MAYSLNGILFSVYGLIPSQAPNSNIAVSGCFDMPIRRGDLFYEWGDENGVEAFVDEDDLMFDGRDIDVYFVVLGTYNEIRNKLKTFYWIIRNFTSTVDLITDYGTFNVYVKSVVPNITNGGSLVKISFREPIVDLTGTIPAIGTSETSIDGVPLTSYGLYFSSCLGQAELTEMKEQYFTSYEQESFQIAKRKANTLTINGFVVGSSIADFKDKISSLYALYSSANMKNITLSSIEYRGCFAVNGFSITDVIVHSNGVIARFSSEWIVSGAYSELILITEDDKIVNTEENINISILDYL